MQVKLKPGREKSLLRGHPWVFSGAILSVQGTPLSGQVVSVHAHDGTFLAWASFSPNSQIRLRVWSFKESDRIDAHFIQARFEQAAFYRTLCLNLNTENNAYRLVHAEADGLPGIIVDRYHQTLVFQLLSAGAEFFREAIIQALLTFNPECLIERSDADVRALEGLTARIEVIKGTVPEEGVLIQEHGIGYFVDPLQGHKTGFYLDQKDNRHLLMTKVKEKRVLNCFCYTGGFSLAAIQGGASEVISIDSSGPALEIAKRQMQHQFSDKADRCTWLEADVFEALRRLRDQGQTFDCIVLDPPKLAPTASHAERAARAYKDINLLAFKLLNPNGQLFTFSCSGGVSLELFRKIVAGSAVDAKKEAFIEHTLSASLDHPVRLSFPEGEYLKGLVLRLL